MSAEWQAKAYQDAKRALRYFKSHPFLAEHLLFAVLRYSPELANEDMRQFGIVIQRLSREKAIDFHGYAPAKSSNGSVKTLWRKL